MDIFNEALLGHDLLIFVMNIKRNSEAVVVVLSLNIYWRLSKSNMNML